jgi:hypothetical protein
MAGYLKYTRHLAMLTVLSLLLSLSACITFVPAENPNDTGDAQTAEVTEKSTVDEAESEKTPDGGTDNGIETDSKGFPNLPEDDQTKRY